MNDKNPCRQSKWWMGRAGFFWILAVAAGCVLAWLMVALRMGMDLMELDLDDFSASGVIPPRIVIKSAAIFVTAVILGFVVFRTRLFVAWVLRRLFNWRMIRRYLYGFGVAALLTALFYGEENWRGKRAWEQYKVAAEAKGERFDLSSFMPRSIPDDQNFAYTPIVAESCFFALADNGSRIEMTNATALGPVSRLDSMPGPTGSLGRPMIFRAIGSAGRESI